MKLIESMNITQNDRCLFNFYNDNTYIDVRDYIFVTFDKDGKWSTADSYNCVILEEKSPVLKPPVMTLMFSQNTGELCLTVSSFELLWREKYTESGISCYAYFDNMKKRILKLKKINTIYNMNLDKTLVVEQSEGFNTTILQLNPIEGPAFYYCYGFSLPYLNQTNSNEIFIPRKPKDTDFAVVLEWKMNTNDTKNISKKNWLIEAKFNFTIGLNYYSMTPIKILSDKWPSTEIEVLFHVNAKSTDHTEHAAIKKKIDSEIRTFVSMRNLNFCLSESSSNFSWPKTPVGQTSRWRKCEGNHIEGGKWEELSNKFSLDEVIAIEKTESSIDLNEILQDMENKNISTTEIINKVTRITSNTKDIKALNIFQISQILQKLPNDFEDLKYLAKTMNNLIYVNNKEMKISQQHNNASNSILDSIENLINNYSGKDLKLADDGTILIREDRTIIFISDPLVHNVSGIALIADDSITFCDKSFDNFKIEKIYANQTIEGLLKKYRDKIELASFLSNDLIENLKKPVKIVIIMYYTNRLYQENTNEKTSKSGNKTISVSLPNHVNIPSRIPLFLKKAKSDNFLPNPCGFWDFLRNEWSTRDCQREGFSRYDKNLVICSCSHLTNFDHLLDNESMGETHENALDIVSRVGGTFSIIGDIITF